MASHFKSFVFSLLSVCVKPWTGIYVKLILIIWSSCYNTSVTGQQVIGSQPVMVRVGDDVILPCHIKPPVSMERSTVVWTRPDLKPEFVYLLQDGRHITEAVNPSYKGRTSLFAEELQHGNISLKLSKVKLSDEGKYTCSAPTLRNSSLIQLLVGSGSHPVISSNGPTDGGVSLSCDSGCWYPQPEMSWLDGDGTLLSAGPSVTETRPPHCYDVQRNVTVRTAGHVTCRVHLTHINHTVETQHYISESDIPTERGSTGSVIAGIIIPIIIILVAAGLGYFYWKKKKHPGYETTSIHQEDQTGATISSTSPIPRKWDSTNGSKKWMKLLEKLANIDDSKNKVTKVGSLVFVKDDEFRIAKGNGIEVYLGLRDDGTEVAVKRMLVSNYTDLQNDRFSHLLELADPSIVRYVEFAQVSDFGYIAIQLCEYNLDEYMAEKNLSEQSRKQLAAYQFLQSLRVLHSQNPPIPHRDIKPQNVLIDTYGNAKLADFGLIQIPNKHSASGKGLGTLYWMATEMLRSTDNQVDGGDIPCPRSSDIQVAGMLIYYILSGGHHPFGSGPRCEVNILDGKYNLDHVQDEVAKALIERMINKDPKERPTVEECWDHPFWSNKRCVQEEPEKDNLGPAGRYRLLSGCVEDLPL